MNNQREKKKLIRRAAVRDAVIRTRQLPNQKRQRVEQSAPQQQSTTNSNDNEEKTQVSLLLPPLESETALVEVSKKSDTEIVMEDLLAMVTDPLLRDTHPPIILKHMIYQRLQDRTAVDRTLDELQHRNLVRQFKLIGDLALRDGIALVYTQHYLHTIDFLLNKLLAPQNVNQKQYLFNIVKDKLLPSTKELTVPKKHVLALLNGSEENLTCVVVGCECY